MTLAEYEKRMGLEPLTPDDLVTGIEDAEKRLWRGDRRPGYDRPEPDSPPSPDRLIMWLAEKLENIGKKMPTHGFCTWCLQAGARTEEAEEVWKNLPLLPLGELTEHVKTCEHNPLVTLLGHATGAGLRARVREIVEGDLPDSELRAAIRALL